MEKSVFGGEKVKKYLFVYYFCRVVNAGQLASFVKVNVLPSLSDTEISKL
jgi:hypothetical protein